MLYKLTALLTFQVCRGEVSDVALGQSTSEEKLIQSV